MLQSMSSEPKPYDTSLKLTCYSVTKRIKGTESTWKQTQNSILKRLEKFVKY